MVTCVVPADPDDGDTVHFASPPLYAHAAVDTTLNIGLSQHELFVESQYISAAAVIEIVGEPALIDNFGALIPIFNTCNP